MADYPTHTETAAKISAHSAATDPHGDRAAATAALGAYIPVAPAWATSTAYATGALVWQSATLYRANTAHTSGASFNASNWTAVSGGGGGGGSSSAWIGWQDIRGGYGNYVDPNGDGFGVGRNGFTLPKSGMASVYLSRGVPPGWATMAIDLFCYTPATPGTPGGQYKVKLNRSVDTDGSDITGSLESGGTYFTINTPSAVMTMTVTNLVSTMTVPSSGGSLNAYFERRPGDTEDTATGDLRVHGMLLRKLT